MQWEESLPKITTPLRNPKVFTFRQRANLFGHNAPDWEQMPAEIKLAVIADKGKLDLLQGGIFHTKNHGDTWNAVSKGLLNADILGLIIRDGVLFAGTAGKGIFRSRDNGNNWEPVNNGLTNLNIQALYTAPDGRSPLFAGTPGGGVFRSKDGGENWVPINTGSVRVEGQGSTNWQSINTSLPNTIVRSILTYTGEDSYGTGTIFIDDTTVRGYGTEFTKELKTSDKITVNVKGKLSITVNQIFSDTLFTISPPSTPFVIPLGTSFQLSAAVKRSYIFVGTDEGIYRSQNQGNDWIAKNLIDKVVYSLLYKDDKDHKNLFLFAGTDKGLYRSSDHGVSWTLIPQEENNSSSFNERAVFALIANEDFIFAGTDAGVFYSSNQGETWQAINIRHDDSSDTLENYKIRSLATYQKDETLYLFAATEQGIFRSNPSENSNSADNFQWALVSPSLPTQDMTALAFDETKKNLFDETKKNLFAGSKFAGFLQSDVEIQNQTEGNNTSNQTKNKPEMARISSFKITKSIWIHFILRFCRRVGWFCSIRVTQLIKIIIN